MKLWALSDLHVRHEENRRTLQALDPHPGDWLILGGDVGETEEHLAFAIDTLAPKFARLFWVPGNHELWTSPKAPVEERGVAHYERLVALCRGRGVTTPEDEFVRWPGDAKETYLAPLFLLYDYSFRPAAVAEADAVAWAVEDGVLCTDEMMLHPHPYPSRQAWCRARCDAAEARLSALPPSASTVLINHFPMREEHAFTPRVPRFKIWCGTRRTEDWHLRYRARVVVFGHLHLPRTVMKDGVRFEEVSLGYPDQRKWRMGLPLLREILSA